VARHINVETVMTAISYLKYAAGQQTNSIFQPMIDELEAALKGPHKYYIDPEFKVIRSVNNTIGNIGSDIVDGLPAGKTFMICVIPIEAQASDEASLEAVTKTDTANST